MPNIKPCELWVAEKIIELVQGGQVPPWNRNWTLDPVSSPRNLIHNKGYRGANFMLTMMLADMYGSPFFITPKQLFELNGKKKDGERTYPLFFYLPITKKDDDGETVKYFSIKHYKVYNVMQTQGIEDRIISHAKTFEHPDIKSCEDIVSKYKNPPTIKHIGQKAFYKPSSDLVQLPAIKRFQSREDYYNVLFHELAHSTAHKDRLNRNLSSEKHEYSEEELIAEFTAAMLCARAGIDKKTVQNSAAYINSWMKNLTPQSLALASRAAQKAARYILAEEND